MNPTWFSDCAVATNAPLRRSSTPTVDACAQAATSELRQRVRAAIDQLPASYRQILLLRDIEQLDTEQTARLLGESVANVKTRLHRARQALRTSLEPLFEAPLERPRP